MIRKLFALLALVGLAAAPMAGWAATKWVSNLSLQVVGNGGTVSMDGNGTQSTSTTTDKDNSVSFNYSISASPADGYSFVGWFETEDCSGNPFSTKTDDTINVPVTHANSTQTGSWILGYTYTRTVKWYAKFTSTTHTCDFEVVVEGDSIVRRCKDKSCPNGRNNTSVTLNAPAGGV